MPSPLSGWLPPTICLRFKPFARWLWKHTKTGLAFLASWVLILSLTENGIQAQSATLVTGNGRINVTGNPSPATHARREWAPPDIDQAVPPVEPGVPCFLPKILSEVGARAEELRENLQQFSANERIEHVKVDKHGNRHARQSAAFTYVAQIHNVSPGAMEIDEYRNGSVSQSFPADLATTGTAAHALIFHPDVIEDFSVTCEGLGSVRGQSAWQLHFAQRANRPPRFRQYRTPRGWFNVELKGRAWISADRYQVMRMETDLAKPIPEIRLLEDHVVIDYRPVEFPSHRLQLWLPETMDIYMDFLDHRSHRRHSFSDFRLFAVDVAQKIEEPKEAAAPSPR